MKLLLLLLYFVAATCFGVAALRRAPRRVNLLALGLLCWVLVPLLRSLGAA